MIFPGLVAKAARPLFFRSRNNGYYRKKRLQTIVLFRATNKMVPLQWRQG